MKTKNDLLLFVFGVVLASMGLILWQNHKADAASQNYSETYTVSKWRDVKSTANSQQKEYSLGASEWTVSGSIGTTQYSETWKASNWRDKIVNTDGTATNSYFSFLDSTTNKSDTSLYGCVPSTPATACQAIPAGSYALSLWDSVNKLLAGASSTPEKWEVTGTITTP